MKQLSLPGPTQAALTKALAQLPVLRVNIADTSVSSLTIGLARLNAHTDKSYRIYAPKYPKPQTEGYFILVTDSASGDILGLKRVSWPSPDKNRGANVSKPTTRAMIKLPESEKERMVNVRVVSDSYLGMEWRVEEVEIPAVPRVVDDGLSKKG